MNVFRNQLTRGAVAGLAGTIPMTAVIGLANAGQLFRTPPPKEITARVVKQAGAEDKVDKPEQFTASWLVSHALFGVTSGVVYVLIRQFLPKSTVAAGVLYGGLVWAVNYLGLMPLLGLYLWPREDSFPRIATMIIAHAVYGTSTAEIDRKLVSSGKSRLDAEVRDDE